MSIHQPGPVAQVPNTLTNSENPKTTTPTQIHRKNCVGHASAALVTKLSANSDACEICQERFVATERIIERHCCHLLTHVSCLSEWANTDPGSRHGASRQRGPAKTFSCPKCRRVDSRAKFSEMLDRAFPPALAIPLGQALEVTDLTKPFGQLAPSVKEEEKGEDGGMTGTLTSPGLEAGVETGNDVGGGSSRIAGHAQEYIEDEMSEDEQEGEEDEDEEDGDQDNYNDDNDENDDNLATASSYNIWAELGDLLTYVNVAESEMPDETPLFLPEVERRAIIPELRRRLDTITAMLNEADRIQTGTSEDSLAIQQSRLYVGDASARLDEAARSLGLM